MNTKTARTLIADAKMSVGQAVRLEAWVPVIRHQGKIVFLVLRDISGTIQAVVFDAALVKQLHDLTAESVIRVDGEIKAAEQAPGGVEIAVTSFEVLSESHPELAIPVHAKAGETSQEKRLDWRWIDLRKPHNQLMFKVWTTAEEAIREYWTSHGYLQIHSPKLINTASESGAEVFRVDYFDGDAYLAQSPQFYKQMAMAAGLERVFEVGPVFRAEQSFTSRHNTEFTGWDAELSFIESHQDVIVANAEAITAMIAGVAEKHGEAIEREFKRKVVVPQLPFPQITMAEAKEKLAKQGIKNETPNDLTPEEERGISKLVAEETGHEFAFVTEWPHQDRAFYHMRLEEGSDLTRGYDLLWNGVEITTGAQREHRPAILEQQAKQKGMDLKPLKHYLNFFRYGCPPHGGMGMGPSRMMMKLLNVENVREVTFAPRSPNRLTP